MCSIKLGVGLQWRTSKALLYIGEIYSQNLVNSLIIALNKCINVIFYRTVQNNELVNLANLVKSQYISVRVSRVVGMITTHDCDGS